MSASGPERSSGGDASGACGGAERQPALFECGPVPTWEQDYSAARALLDQLRGEGVADLAGHLRGHPELVQRCVGGVRILAVNRAALALLGASGEERALTDLGPLFPPETLATVGAGIVALYEGATELKTEALIGTVSGEPRHVDVFISVVPGHEATLSRVMVSLVDATDRWRAEQALRESERRYREVFTNSTDVLYVLEVTGDGRFRNLDVNTAFERSCGLSAGQVLGRCQEEVVDAETARIVNAKYRRCVEARVPIHERSVLDLPSGRRAYASTLVPIPDAAGRVYRILGVSRDITDQYRAEEEVRTLNRELEARVAARTAELQAAKDELEAFAYSVSHDLRAPVRHMDGFAGLLRARAGDVLDPQSLAHLEAVAASARRMGALIDDLLAFSRMGRRDLVRTPVDLSALAAEVRAELAPEAAGRDVRWRIADLPVVSGDGAMLRQVLVNLLANALKFTRTRPVAEVELRAAASPAEVVVSVRDNGVGFDMKHAGKLFGVFQRLHRAEEFEGTGIGLATVRRIVGRHGGRVWAEARIDEGATFSFALPGAAGGDAER